MDKLVEMGIFYEFYGQLLTEPQQKAMEQFYLNDLSLNEIADNFQISKQAVSESIQRAEKKLIKMEETLHLYEKYRHNIYMLDQAISLTNKALLMHKNESLIELLSILEKLKGEVGE